MTKLIVAFCNLWTSIQWNERNRRDSSPIWGIIKVLPWTAGAKPRKRSDKSASRHYIRTGPLPNVRSFTARTAWNGPLRTNAHLLSTYIRRYRAIHSLHTAQNQSRFYRPQTMRWSSHGKGHVWQSAGALLAIGETIGLYWYNRQALLLLHPDWKHQVFRVTCSESVHCTTALRMGSSNSPFTSKTCAGASIVFLEWIIPWSVESTCISLNIRRIKKCLK